MRPLIVAVLFLVSCAHVTLARFADDSGSEKGTMWLCRADAKSTGDLECIDLRRVTNARTAAEPPTSEM